MAYAHTNKKWVAFIALLTLTGWLPATYGAPKLTISDLFSLSLKELLQIRITVSTLTEESLRDVPASVTVFTQAQIRQLGVTTLTALMNHVPGYQSYRTDHSNATFSSRSRRLTLGTREVLLLLDGQRLNHDLAGDWLNSGFSLGNVERVEYLRGGWVAIYGANAFLGVVNIITASNLNDATLSAGNDQQKTANLNISGNELEWQWYFATGWQLRSELSHLFKGPLNVNADAEDLLRSSLLYSQDNITASVSGRYHAHSRDANTSAAGYGELSSYTLFDAHGHYQVTPQWQVYGNLRNLTDKHYTQPALQNASNIEGVPGLGREIEVGVYWNF